MHYDPCPRTFDCEPTLTDSEVLEFCREGHLLLRGVVPDEINQRTCAWIDGDIPANPSYIPDGLTEADLDRIRFTHEPTSIFLEDWFIEHVLLNPQLAGAMRSLLGPNIGLPVLASHHRAECPMEAQRWHQDADHIYGPEVRFLEVFYFPQDTPVERGPTRVITGTHLQPYLTRRDYPFAFVADDIRGRVLRRPGRHHWGSPSEYHAPPWQVHRQGSAPDAQVQLLAHGTSSARLDRRGGL